MYEELLLTYRAWLSGSRRAFCYLLRGQLSYDTARRQVDLGREHCSGRNWMPRVSAFVIGTRERGVFFVTIKNGNWRFEARVAGAVEVRVYMLK